MFNRGTLPALSSNCLLLASPIVLIRFVGSYFCSCLVAFLHFFAWLLKLAKAQMCYQKRWINVSHILLFLPKSALFVSLVL